MKRTRSGRGAREKPKGKAKQNKKSRPASIQAISRDCGEQSPVSQCCGVLRGNGKDALETRCGCSGCRGQKAEVNAGFTSTGRSDIELGPCEHRGITNCLFSLSALCQNLRLLFICSLLSYLCLISFSNAIKMLPQSTTVVACTGQDI